MKNHQEPDWEKLISDTIESALHSGDFTQLKQTLGTTFETVKKQTPKNNPAKTPITAAFLLGSFMAFCLG